MKSLYVFRHAKSDWEADYDTDHSRPLATRGVKAARKMGLWLTATGRVPDRALASSALRARQTLALAAEAGGWAGPAQITDALYGASPEALLREIRRTPDAASSLVVVGHEPTHSRLVSLLIGGGQVEMKTGTVAQIEIYVDSWSDVAAGRGVLVGLSAPGQLRPNTYRKLRKAVESARDALDNDGE